MQLPKHYDPKRSEARWQRHWAELGIYQFDAQDPRPVMAIDTPPPTVSGDLHLGHCYSYSQTDFLARYWRMRGYNVYYPMGWDDNGLPTERLVEKRLGLVPRAVGRERFAEAIREVSDTLEQDYRRLWQRLGLSVDWRHTYRTVSARAQKLAQYSFIDLYHKGLAYRASAPTIWCPLCGTAIAQAEVDDLEREAELITLAFTLDDGRVLPIATTRAELLPACVAIFVHPTDGRFSALVGRRATTPLFAREVPILADHAVDQDKGTGAVMCCTFGDAADVQWWRAHGLPLVRLVERDGTLGEAGGAYAGLPLGEARERILADLAAEGMVLARERRAQTVRVHERCDTPIEYVEAPQWFIKLLEHKEDFLRVGRAITWRPASMQARYEHWVQNLAWDWCISRQRYYGVPFPVWYCADCGAVRLADPAALPVVPWEQGPAEPCGCGSARYQPDTDVMDTWATSSLTPQMVGYWLEDEAHPSDGAHPAEGAFFERVFPMALRPHAHEIIRTWTFYTIVKSWYHLGRAPWRNVSISGYGLLPEGGKISKSRGGGPHDPWQMIDRYSADAVRYWASSAGLGRDALVSEDRIASGQRLVTKLWNVARFALPFLEGYAPPDVSHSSGDLAALWPTDRWILDRLQRVIERATACLEEHDHLGAREEVEGFFWNILADNYLEMVKGRLYERPEGDPGRESARYALYHVLLNVCKLFAPVLPYISEEIYQSYHAGQEGRASIHSAPWPCIAEDLAWPEAETVGAALLGIATAVRRAKTDRHLRLSALARCLEIAAADQGLRHHLAACTEDLQSVSRAERIVITSVPGPGAMAVDAVPGLWINLEMGEQG